MSPGLLSSSTLGWKVFLDGNGCFVRTHRGALGWSCCGCRIVADLPARPWSTRPCTFPKIFEVNVLHILLTPRQAGGGGGGFGGGCGHFQRVGCESIMKRIFADVRPRP